MDKSQFSIIQFKTLREEIKETKDRIFKLVSFGIFAVPTAHFIAQTYNLDIIILSLPLLVIVIALLYLSENHAMMRCGRYIREQIEPNMDGIMGWETWLENNGQFNARTVEKYANYCFYLLIFIYYAGSVFMASRFTYNNYGVVNLSILLGFYIAIGIWFLIFFIGGVQTSTSTKYESK